MDKEFKFIKDLSKKYYMWQVFKEDNKLQLYCNNLQVEKKPEFIIINYKNDYLKLFEDFKGTIDDITKLTKLLQRFIDKKYKYNNEYKLKVKFVNTDYNLSVEHPRVMIKKLFNRDIRFTNDEKELTFYSEKINFIKKSNLTLTDISHFSYHNYQMLFFLLKGDNILVEYIIRLNR